MLDGLAIVALWLVAIGPLAAAGTGETPVAPGAMPKAPAATPIAPAKTPVAPGATPVAPGATPVAPARPAATPSAALTGRLNVDGDAVQQVFLGKMEAGDTVDVKKAIALRAPNWHVAIPIGQYAVVRIDLKGGYVHIAPLRVVDGKVHVPREAERLTIRPDKPCALKIGAPLKPALLVGRRGRVIQMLYGLHDAQLRYYAEKIQDKPPQFTVSCDGREIASGALQYGKAATYSGAWRVPSTIFSGPLTVVASADLGAMGHRQSEPVLVEWHWYDQLSNFAGWALIAVLLVLVKENRNREALMVLVPFVLLSELLWPWIAYFLAVLSVDTGQIAYPFQWLLVAWTALWLLSPWLSRLHPALAISLALALAATVGAAAEFGLSQRLVFSPALMNYAILAFGLLLAFLLSGLCCRRKCTPGRFLLWLAPWLILGVALGAIAELVRVYACGYGLAPLPAVADLIPGLMVSSLCFAGALYLLSLPYMYLALHSALYGERFHKTLRLPEYVPPAEAPPEADEDDEDNEIGAV
jgi:hypothetical protein